jgi:hypothetical protein
MSCPEHRYASLHPVLPLVTSDNTPIARDSSYELGVAHQSALLRGSSSSAPSLGLLSRARAAHHVTVAPERLHSPCRGRECLTSDNPSAALQCTAAASLPSSTATACTPLGSRGDSGRHGGLGLAGDLAVGEISPVSAALAQPRVSASV